jgi:predicted Zn-dependent protease with MMP-like domain
MREDAIERAWSAYEEASYEEALEAAACLPDEDPRRWLLEAMTRVELGDLGAARAWIDRLRGLDAFERDPDCQWADARLALREWRIADARRILAQLAELDPTMDVYETLALCDEVDGRFERARKHVERAFSLAPDGWQPPPSLSPEAFEAVVREAAERLPPAFRAALEETEVIVEPAPSVDLIDRSEPGETPPDMLGLFIGGSALERDLESLDLPPRIYLFQHNLERASFDLAHLEEEIHVTLYHELGHLLGLDEDGVADLGLE